MDIQSFSDSHSAHAIWIQPNSDGHWAWELIDGEGRTDLKGAAPGRDSALATARFASDAIDALQRIRSRRS